MTHPPLPSDLAQFVAGQIGSGRYGSEHEVFLEGLRLLRDREQRIAQLRAEVAPAAARLERGEGREIDVEEVLSRGMERLQSPGS